jgi:hypothetical protein
MFRAEMKRGLRGECKHNSGCYKFHLPRSGFFFVVLALSEASNFSAARQRRSSSACSAGSVTSTSLASTSVGFRGFLRELFFMNHVLRPRCGMAIHLSTRRFLPFEKTTLERCTAPPPETRIAWGLVSPIVHRQGRIWGGVQHMRRKEFGPCGRGPYERNK